MAVTWREIFPGCWVGEQSAQAATIPLLRVPEPEEAVAALERAARACITSVSRRAGRLPGRLCRPAAHPRYAAGVVDAAELPY